MSGQRVGRRASEGERERGKVMNSVLDPTEMMSNRRNMGLVSGRESAWRNRLGKQVGMSRKKKKRKSLSLQMLNLKTQTRS